MPVLASTAAYFQLSFCFGYICQIPAEKAYWDPWAAFHVSCQQISAKSIRDCKENGVKNFSLCFFLKIFELDSS